MFSLYENQSSNHRLYVFDVAHAGNGFLNTSFVVQDENDVGWIMDTMICKILDIDSRSRWLKGYTGHTVLHLTQRAG